MKIFAIAILTLLLSFPSNSAVQSPIFSTFELSFISDTIYDNPYLETELFCNFISPSNIEYKVGGFWDGGRKFKIRLLPDEIGTWSYKTCFSDTLNKNLHNQDGIFFVIDKNPTNEFELYGLPIVKKDERIIYHKDGTSLFLINDVAWRIYSKSRKEEVIKYISDRKSKGFNAISLVVIDDLNVNNYATIRKDSLFEDSNYQKISISGISYLDFIVKTANDSGMAVMICPLWGSISEVNFDSVYNKKFMPKSESLKFASYLAARMAGYNVIWIVAGDGDYSLPERKSFWREFGRILKKYSGSNKLTTCHTKGYTGTFNYFDITDEWVDFYSYQSSHSLTTDFTWFGGNIGYESFPIKPNYNFEPPFEDLKHEFWKYDNSGIRFEDHHLRKAYWESILGGGLCGISYGANGIFDWNTREEPGWFEPSFIAVDAMKLKGSSQLKNTSILLKTLGWPNFIPYKKIVIHDTNKLYIITTLANNKSLLSYIPKFKGSVSFNLSDFIKKDLVIKWYNPVNLNESKPIFYSKNSVDYYNLLITPPDTNDWVLKMDNYDADSTPEINSNNDIRYFPSPASDYLNLEFQKGFYNIVELKIYDILGNLVISLSNLYSDNNIIKIDLSKIKQGTYFIETKTENKIYKSIFIKI